MKGVTYIKSFIAAIIFVIILSAAHAYVQRFPSVTELEFEDRFAGIAAGFSDLVEEAVSN